MPSTDPADNGHGDPFPDRPPQYVRALARNWAASRDRRKSLTLTARRQLRRRFAEGLKGHAQPALVVGMRPAEIPRRS